MYNLGRNPKIVALGFGLTNSFNWFLSYFFCLLVASFPSTFMLAPVYNNSPSGKKRVLLQDEISTPKKKQYNKLLLLIYFLF